MFTYIIKRLLLMVLTIWMVMSITFILLSFMPGTPYANDKLKESDIARLDHENGFDDPLYLRYADYITNIIGLEGLLQTEGGYNAAKPVLEKYKLSNETIAPLNPEKDAGEISTELGSLPKDGDYDGDGFSNYEEVKMRSNPKVADIDTDSDGNPDSVDLDDDADGLSDIDETENGLNPLDPSDGGKVKKVDGKETYTDFADTDGDGLSNDKEIANGTDPIKVNIDTDKDGVVDTLDLDDDNDKINDIDELDNQLDPLDPSDAQKDFDKDGVSNVDEIYAFSPERDPNYAEDPDDVKREIFGFNFGKSFQSSEEVLPDLIEAYKYSFIIGIFSLILGSAVGIMLGLLAALRKNGPLDVIATTIAVIGVSFPSFIFATLLQKYAPSFFPSIFSKGNILSFVLPVIALSVFAVAQTARVTRTEMVEVLGSNFITLGRAKGASNKKIVFGYAFRNSMIAILTIFGPLMVSLTTGSLVVEQIFGIPGLGGKMTQGVLTNDIYVVLGVTFFITLQITLMYLIVDILYAFVDPRIRVGGKK